MDDLLEVLGDRPCAVARELTKLHEEIFRGSLSAAREHFARQGARGEFTLVVGGASTPAKTRWSEAQLRQAIRRERRPGESPSSLAKRLADDSGWDRREIYRLIE
jgi:16S rRNA (cytidine1402-2'-O)-methyltransferase